MWIFDASGKRTDATAENAADMVEFCGYSALYPKGTPEEEAAEFARLAAADGELQPRAAPPEDERRPFDSPFPHVPDHDSE